jgi:hypothetical protein
MRFRPLCIDYHAEALHMEEEQKRLAEETRSTIENLAHNDTIRSECNHANKDDDTNTKDLDEYHVPSTEFVEQHMCKQKCSVDNTNDDQASTTITPTPIKKRRRDPTEAICRVDDDKYVASFKPLPAYMKCCMDYSVSRFWTGSCYRHSSFRNNGFNAFSRSSSQFQKH